MTFKIKKPIFLISGLFVGLFFPTISLAVTVTTSQTDAVHSLSTKNSTGLKYEGVYQQFVMPELTNVESIDAASLFLYVGQADADYTFSIYCDEVAAWTEASSAANLEALSFNTALTSSAQATATGWQEYNILGTNGVNGIANAYAGGSTASNVTCKLFKNLSVTQIYAEQFFLFGSYSDDYVSFQDNDDANYPYISITYTATDITPPTVTAFDIPATASSLTVDITTFTATDNTAVTGYKLTESATAPLAGDAGWTATAPTDYTFDSEGVKTLYAWAKDAAGNVSTSLNDTVTITLPPTVSRVIRLSGGLRLLGGTRLLGDN